MTKETATKEADLPLVTALLPSYNAEAFIRKTLDSLVAQSWLNLEILIGDDFSTDGTPEIIQEYAARYENIRVLNREKNLGWLGNCNDLMANARGDMMFFAFHDDVVAPDYVSSLATALQREPDAILAYSDLELVDPDGTREFLDCAELSGVTNATMRGLMYARRRPDFHWWIPNRGIFRKQAYTIIGGIPKNEYGEFSADWTWLLHLSLLGPFIRVPETLCFKHYQKSSLSINWKRTSAKYRGLARSGIKEVMRSDLDLFAKLLICGYLQYRILGSKVKSLVKGS
ncbi:glycosyltransferase family 2 protein [Sneathiella litorea]|uniref:Glycosyltransferase n=1 Tax=Sneathiella litorea TaxID=2606216 RepID=A0A6L8WBY0_9PROT|nr:glycosyltransferase [Sneathiella litorea]MZR31637.1 glycosyltransferase [Sneathiella litorea]